MDYDTLIPPDPSYRDVSRQGRLLCLRCREPGHMAGACTTTKAWVGPQFQYEWFFSPARTAVGAYLQAASIICKRCQNLGLVELLRFQIPWHSLNEVSRYYRDGHHVFRKLGQAATVKYHSSCRICVCLFAMTPWPSAPTDDILLFPDWTLNLLAGETWTNIDREEKRKSSKYLRIVAGIYAGCFDGPRLGDGLCILGRDLAPSFALGGKMIQHDRFDVERVHSWLSACRKPHGQYCEPTFTDLLHGIRLVDVAARKVVSFPGGSCKYAALSYVWGGTKQESYRLGSHLASLPKTIEDALECAQLLGIPHIWVDSLCIDQEDEFDTADQITRMRSIYSGSSLTLVALSSPSADSGMPLFSVKREQPQLACTIDNVRLAGLSPTLLEGMHSSMWGRRAWTMQEAILSHRCLYIGEHQLYFECQAMQCCESLDERHSWTHNLTPDMNPEQGNWLSWVRKQSGLGVMRNLDSNASRRLFTWNRSILNYSLRHMTEEEDALRAFGGILTGLEEMYTAGFFWGLPLEDFNWALLWEGWWPMLPVQFPPLRRKFPTWCWAGWNMPFSLYLPIDYTDPHQYPVSLRVWKAQKDKLILIFDADNHAVTPRIRATAGKSLTQANCAAEAYRVLVRKGSERHQRDGARDILDLKQHWMFGAFTKTQQSGLLLMEVQTIDFELDLGKPMLGQLQPGSRGFIKIDIAGVECFLYMYASNPFLVYHSKLGCPAKYLLLAFDAFQEDGGAGEYPMLRILIVYQQGGFYFRGTSLMLCIPSPCACEVISALKTKKEYIILV